MQTTIDRGDAHHHDAGGWPEACHHMGVFLAWAASRGLADPRHTAELARLEATPASYIVRMCDTKLLPDDFAADEALIRGIYAAYLPFYNQTVLDATGKVYVIGLDPDVVNDLRAFLDRELGPRQPGVRADATAPAAAAPIEVSHPKFGRGVIVREFSEGGRAKVVVAFETVGEKTLLRSYLEPAS